MQELMCFNAFLCQYIESFVFLEVGGGGGYSPLPKSANDTYGHRIKNGHRLCTAILTLLSFFELHCYVRSTKTIRHSS